MSATAKKVVEAKRPSQVFAARLRDIRERKRWRQHHLAERLGELGNPTDRATVARTETGARGVSLDDALMYAAALDVSPLALLLPERPDEPVRLAPGFDVEADEVAVWLEGSSPLQIRRDAGSSISPSGRFIEEVLAAPHFTADGKELDYHAVAEMVRFFEETLPLFGRWKGARKPGVQHLLDVTNHYATAAGQDNRQEMKRRLAQLAAEVERQQTALDDGSNNDEGRRWTLAQLAAEVERQQPANLTQFLADAAAPVALDDESNNDEPTR